MLRTWMRNIMISARMMVRTPATTLTKLCCRALLIASTSLVILLSTSPELVAVKVAYRQAANLTLQRIS